MKTPESSLALQNYQRLIEISLDLSSTLELNSLLRRIVTAAAEISDAEAASILLYNNEKHELYFESSTDENNQQALQKVAVPMESVAGWVVLNQTAAIIPDVHADPRYYGIIEKTVPFPTRMMIAVPLLAKNRTVGVLEVLNKRHGVFTSDDAGTLSLLGSQAALAIENARLFLQADLIADLVHEIRTPLTSIATITYLLQRPDITLDQRLSLTATIQREITRLNHMADSFLDLARLESGRAQMHFEPTDPIQILTECLEVTIPKANEAGISIDLQICEQIPLVELDRDKFKQVILNLLTNALKYNAPRGKISITQECLPDTFRLSIADSGIGIPAEDLPHLFEKFYRSANGEPTASGTGLGLSICKQIVEGHQGKILVDSVLGKGSTFTISIPVRQTAT